MIGTTLSHYKIVSEIGRGGMGIVYKAEDTKLKRVVALKLLPQATVGNEDDRARFLREAQAAAQLQHANIATVYAIEETSVGEEKHQPFIAMEYIEGETLTERIEAGPMKLTDVVDIATQVALALEAAHEKNIVHRDVKSGNVMLTKKGNAKVLDFGLAKTAQSTKLTQLGSTLGTVAYMSPEQARGEEVDRRSDIWSLGVLTYEMIAGRMPFSSEYEQAAVYSILNEDPEPLTGVRSGVPMGLEWIVSKLLAKNVNDRYQNISDLLVDLRTVDLQATGMSRISKPSIATPSVVTEKPVPSSGGVTRYVVGAVVGAGLMFLAWMFTTGGSSPTEGNPTLRLSHMLASPRLPAGIDISHDGTKVAYILDLVNVLDLTTGRSYELEGTESTTVAEFSPDGEWLLLTKTVSIERIPVGGGTPVLIVESSEGGPRANWAPDDWIIFEDVQNFFRFSESRSELVQVTRTDTTAGEEDVDWPSMLPDGKTIMGTLERGEVDPPQVRFWDFETGEVRSTINFAGYRVQYHETGHLSGVVGGEGLVIVPFDIDRLEITGPRVPVVAEVVANRVSISQNGTVVYTDAAGTDEQLVLSVPTLLQFPRFRQQLPVEPGFYSNVELSPDETKLVYIKRERVIGSGLGAIHIFDFESQTARQITSSNTMTVDAVTWMPGSDSVAYTRPSLPGGPHSIYVRAADGSGEEQRYMTGVSRLGEIDISPDGNTVVYTASAGTGISILRKYSRRPGSERMTIAGLDVSSRIVNPQISSDGNHVAYQQTESVYVRPIDGSGTPFNVSFGFAQFPRWSKDGRYFFETTLGGSVQQFTIDQGTAFSVSQGYDERGILGDLVPYFDVFDDGERAIVADIIDDPAASDSLQAPAIPLRFVINWFEEIKE